MHTSYSQTIKKLAVSLRYGEYSPDVVNKLQEISGQVIRIAKQQYGQNDDRYTAGGELLVQHLQRGTIESVRRLEMTRCACRSTHRQVK